MESMTGFSQAHVETEKFSLSVQLKSVNARYLEQKFFSPKSLFEMENAFRSEIKKEIPRGTVEALIKYNRNPQEKLSSLKGKKKFVKDYQKIAKDLGIRDDLSVQSLLKISFEDEKETLSKIDKSEIQKTFKKALKLLRESRLKEGKNLQKVLNTELKTLKSDYKKTLTWFSKFKPTLKKDFEEKLKKHKLDLDPERVEQEMVLLIEKGDITEELDRFGIHLKEFEKLMKASGLIGKKLDFYCQELTREANTMGSKSKNAELTRLSVNLKTSVEKLRQQVQNIQ